jgi:hypothetical protein
MLVGVCVSVAFSSMNFCGGIGELEMVFFFINPWRLWSFRDEKNCNGVFGRREKMVKKIVINKSKIDGFGKIK